MLEGPYPSSVLQPSRSLPGLPALQGEEGQMTDRQEMLARRAQMNGRLKNFYIRKSAGLAFLHWTRCGLKNVHLPRLERGKEIRKR